PRIPIGPLGGRIEQDVARVVEDLMLAKEAALRARIDALHLKGAARRNFKLPPSLTESLTAHGMPGALLEYKKGWDGWSGTIPTDRKDMWGIYYNYYLTSIRDEDRSIQPVVA